MTWLIKIQIGKMQRKLVQPTDTQLPASYMIEKDVNSGHWTQIREFHWTGPGVTLTGKTNIG